MEWVIYEYVMMRITLPWLKGTTLQRFADVG